MGAFDFYLAPMLDVTTPHFRRFFRLIDLRTTLFTEMVVADTIIRMSDEDLLEKIGMYEGNTVVQVGGSNPETIAAAIETVMKKIGFKSFNLNCGCPSTRVKKGRFGAILMLDPILVSEIINVTEKKCGVVMSLKIRLGVDEHDSYDFVHNFIETIVKNTNCDTFFVHARKCWLNGMSPAANRNRPPLNYEYVYRVKGDFPDKKFILNGGIVSLEQLDERRNLDGFMIGRGAVNNMNIFNEMTSFLSRKELGHVFGDDNRKENNSPHFLCSYENSFSKYQELPQDREMVDNFDKRINLNLKEILREYINAYDSDAIVRYTHVFPLMSFLHGKKYGKRHRKYLTSIVSQKNTFGTFYNNITEYFGDFCAIYLK